MKKGWLSRTDAAPWRATSASRTVAGNDAAAAGTGLGFNDRGDLTSESHTLAGFASRQVGLGSDQSGNRTSITYPGGAAFASDFTPINRLSASSLNGQAFLSYGYSGRVPTQRSVTTTTPGGGNVYRLDLLPDSHRRQRTLNNWAGPVGNPLLMAGFGFELDSSGNPVAQSASGIPAFANDFRNSTVDELDRLVLTEFSEQGYSSETLTLDLEGNRESVTGRDSVTTGYGAANPGNEYAAVNGTSLAYDGAGNLTVDEDGRTYAYDEHNRLTEVRAKVVAPATTGALLAAYTYDALGRRVSSTIGNTVTRFIYSGDTLIEERDETDALTRWHVSGGSVQGRYVDERIATFTTSGSTSIGQYYLEGNTFGVVGVGNADGTLNRRLSYTSMGDFKGQRKFDAEGNGDVALADFMVMQTKVGSIDPGSLQLFSVDTYGPIDVDDLNAFGECMNGVGVAPPSGCGGTSDTGPGTSPRTGDFAMQGRWIDVLPDGKVLLTQRPGASIPS